MVKAYKSFKFIFFILLIFNGTLLPSTQVQTTISKFSDVQSQKYSSLTQKYDQIYIDKLLKQYGPDFCYKIVHAQEIKDKELAEKNNTLITQFPILNGKSIGIYRGDLVRGSSFATETGLDFALFNYFQKYYHQQIFENIILNVDQILNKLAQKPLDYPLNKNIVNNNLPKNILSYFIPAEGLRLLKAKLLGKQDITSFKKFISGSWNAHFSNTQPKTSSQETPIPISYIIESAFVFSQPLYSAASYGNHILNEFLKLLNLRPEFLDSYLIKISKELSVLTLYMNWFNKNSEKKLIKHVGEHQQEFTLLLTQYKQAKTNSDKEEVERYENKLKKFISKSQDKSFYEWLKSKNIIITKNKFLTNAVINLPVYFLLIKMLFKQTNTRANT